MKSNELWNAGAYVFIIVASIDEQVSFPSLKWSTNATNEKLLSIVVAAMIYMRVLWYAPNTIHVLLQFYAQKIWRRRTFFVCIVFSLLTVLNNIFLCVVLLCI